jgi:hypothetical protein
VEGFEGPEPTWQFRGSDASYRIERNQRVAQQAHGGDWCEQWSLAAGHGTFAHLSHEVPPARVVNELRAGLWLRSDRAGLEFLARVVLPATVDPQTGEPLKALVRGGQYDQVGRWQRLQIDDIPRQVEREVRRLRLDIGPQVDARGVYVDRVMLNIYGGAGETNVWIDDLEVAPLISVESLVVNTAGTGLPGEVVSTSALQTAARGPRVKLSGATLLVNDRPVLARIIRHQGEPLEWLQQVGFNVVWLASVPPRDLLAEAERLGVGLICPPPLAADVKLDPDRPTEIPREFDPVLLWDMGAGLAGADLDRVKNWSQQVRLADGRMMRPLICAPDSDLRSYSRYVNVLLLGRSPLGTTLELVDYGAWLRERPRLARPGTPVWTTVQTQPTAPLAAQWRGIVPRRALDASIAEEQVRLLTYTALACGMRGICFESQSRLDASDPATQLRAATLELLNLELDLLEPWVTSGEFLTTVTSSSDPDISGAVLQTDRSRLLIAMWSGRGGQFVAGQAAANNIPLVVPSASEASDVYLVSPAGLRPLQHDRVAGGVRVVVDEFGLTTAVLLCQDDLALAELTRRLASVQSRAAELQRQAAGQKFMQVGELDRQLQARGKTVRAANDWLADAREHLGLADQRLGSGSVSEAYLEAQRAMRPLRMLERKHWEAAVAELAGPVVHPLAVSASGLAEYYRSSELISQLQTGTNLLPGGDFENFDRTLGAGWKHFRHPHEGLASTADLSPIDPRRGRYALRMSVKATDEKLPQAIVETAPIWVTSARVQVQAGQYVRISGWVNVPIPVIGSVDGLMIFDSLGGQPLALRYGQTGDWQPFSLVRVAPQSGPLWVTFAMTGLGEASIDDIRIEPLEVGTPGNTPTRLPAARGKGEGLLGRVGNAILPN